jgi:hypothetical protein
MLAERNDDAGCDPEIDRELEFACEGVARLEETDIDPGDIGAAVTAYRHVYQQIEDRRAA